jgi:hypothetical protein
MRGHVAVGLHRLLPQEMRGLTASTGTVSITDSGDNGGQVMSRYFSWQVVQHGRSHERRPGRPLGGEEALMSATGSNSVVGFYAGWSRVAEANGENR